MSPFYCFSARVFLLAYLGAITLPSASRAHEDMVQLQCSSINDPEFDYQAIVQEGFEIKWTMDMTADTVTFEVFNAAESWTSIGFSEDGHMIGSDAVIGLPANGSVNEYNLTAKAVTAIDLFDDQEITDATLVQDTDGTMITFTRPLTPANSEKQTLSSTPGGENAIIWAFGEANELAFHGENYGSFLLDLSCETASGNMTTTPTASPTSAPTGANSAGGVHGSFGAGSSGGGWWVTAFTGLSVLLGATLALSW